MSQAAGTETHDYLMQLKEYQPSIAEFIGRCQMQSLEAEDYAGLLRIAHNLGLVSASYGYPDIGDISTTLELSMIRQEPLDALIPLIYRLHMAIHRALVFLPSDGVFRPWALSWMPVILTVDDDRTVCATVASLFEGYAKVQEAANGHLALEMIRNGRPDIVLLDDTMPEMSGLRLLDQLKDDPVLSTVRVIMLTSSDRPQDMARAYEAGAVDYVLKPFNPVQLADRVWTILSFMPAFHNTP